MGGCPWPVSIPVVLNRRNGEGHDRQTWAPVQYCKGDSNADSEVLAFLEKRPRPARTAFSRSKAGDVRRIQRVAGQVQGPDRRYGR